MYTAMGIYYSERDFFPPVPSFADIFAPNLIEFARSEKVKKKKKREKNSKRPGQLSV